MKSILLSLLLSFCAVIVSVAEAKSAEQPFSTNKIDSLFYIFEAAQGRNRVEAANILQNEIHHADLINEVHDISYDEPLIKIDAHIYCIMGTAALMTGDNYSGIKYYEKGIALYEELGDKQKQTRYMLNLHFCYKMTGDYPKATDYLNKCLAIFTENNEEEMVARTLYSIGMLYSENDRDSIAVEYLNKALAIQRKLDLKVDFLATLQTLSDAYIKLNDIGKAEPFAEEALSIAKELNILLDWESSLHTIGLVYIAKGEYDKAISSFQQALNINEANNGRTDYKAYSYYLLGETFRVSGRETNKAEEYFLQSISLSEEAENEYYQNLAYEGLVNLNQTHNPQKALDYLLKHVEIKEILFNNQTRQQLNDFQIKYQTQQKELEIVRQQSEIKQHKSNRTILVICLILSLFILILFFILLRQRTKRNRVLSEINATKDKFFSIISHDLKNPAIAQRDALQLLITNSKDFNAEALTQYYTELLNSADGHVELLYNLLNWAQVQTGRMPYKPVKFDLVSTLRSDIILFENMSKRKGVIFNVQVPETVLITGDSNMTATIVRNLLTNAIKFTPAGKTVSLNITPSTAGGYTIEINDTGVGMSEEQKQNMFRIDNRQSKKGTSGETGSGLGLIVCKELIEKHGSSLQVESELNKGSNFRFNLS